MLLTKGRCVAFFSVNIWDLGPFFTDTEQLNSQRDKGMDNSLYPRFHREPLSFKCGINTLHAWMTLGVFGVITAHRYVVIISVKTWWLKRAQCFILLDDRRYFRPLILQISVMAYTQPIALHISVRTYEMEEYNNYHSLNRKGSLQCFALRRRSVTPCERFQTIT